MNELAPNGDLTVCQAQPHEGLIVSQALGMLELVLARPRRVGLNSVSSSPKYLLVW